MKSPRILLLSALAVLIAAASSVSAAESKLMIGMLPKAKGNAYFISCKNGADKAAKELGVELLFDGPTDSNAAKQNEIVENWITLGLDVITVAAENKESLSTALRKARAQGIAVLTYDADAMPDARSFFVNQATPAGIALGLLDKAAELAGGEGEIAIITATLTAGNQREWLRIIHETLPVKYPKLKLIAVRPSDDLKDKAQSEATALMSAHPNLEVIVAICTPGTPGAAEAVKQAGKTGKVHVIGLGLPNENRRYVHEGVTDAVMLWNTEDLGYLTVYAAAALAHGELKPGAKSFQAGALGSFEITGDNILLGKPYFFTKENIDRFDF
ncbi:Autoinducer 2-binding protein LsrB precursor [Lacunisphaera limnophila]|uniref:Autoinducer 2-binding protein LsrB n=1 Tax=Lacunisphaera limnophila TaxID=1838286 RepID=A0A1D8ATI8_9BACT|nr:substrate-binding domain-containing protein [Lacunisphaera limnophila]AOS44215.1 Autoinducer 2-binding protein LsrB precursor [Lacunisphaera limnophila]